MRVVHVVLVALTLTSGCIRVGYDALSRAPLKRMPDASHDDGANDGSIADAAVGGTAGNVGGASGQRAAGTGADAGRVNAGSGGADAGPAGSSGAGSSAAGSGGAGSAGAAGESDGGADLNTTIGDGGLHVSDILGFYSGDWGDMVLREVNGEIWGSYSHDTGTIVGSITGDGVFAGWWSQLPSRTGRDAGEVEFRWSGTSGTAIALDGRWRYGTTGDWLENWDVDLVTDRTAPSDLTSRFDDPSQFKRHP